MIKPISETIKAKRHTPQYQMHKYYARRPHNIFNNLIKHYSEEGDIVLDCFCGGGVTISEGLSINRKVIGIDINPLATFITEMQIQQVDIKILLDYFQDFYTRMENKFASEYLYRLGGEEVSIEWTEWIYEVNCYECNTIIELSQENKLSNGIYKCSNPNCSSNINERNGVNRTKCLPHSSVPIRMKYSKLDGSTNVNILSDEEKQAIKNQLAKYEFKNNFLTQEIPSNWDRWYEDCLPQKGVTTFADFFTERNLFINLEIFNEIINLPKSQMRDLLYFAFSSSLRYTNKMSRVTENWENGSPTCMDKHAYWLPNEYVEVNILKKLNERMQAVIKGLEYTRSHIKSEKLKAETFEELLEKKDYLILTQSASKTPIPDKSIDVVITDPPYGSNVQYGELSAFWNVWYMQYKNLDNFIFNDEEAVVNRKSCFEGAKDVDHYGDMLTEVFTEASRVLKDKGYLVFTFNNKNINVWVQVLKAIVRAGFNLPEDGIIYQDFIKEYKNTSHLKYSGNIHGDFIYSFRKEDFEFESEKLGDFKETIETRIIDSLRHMYEIKTSYTTTELYERIYSSIVRVLMAYVYQDETNDIEVIEELSKTFIDDIIGKYLVLNSQLWTLKEGE
ncbi:DNA methyltransferase [Serpentinicella sp. ANB-PHB4]|uniref:DNA methyltransferase n=1 Tax=Serpentinicella sp. ANB-PHB4 TaxID=3074076 RepID=UPI0028645030|nr:DNA methyltransferase [Serpentinicella sp. ANB-PHB4]MDR5659868.1 DNA methyltransferase [Serpentinicella sp. ANB-PHB4]